MATESYLYQGEYAQSLIAKGHAKGFAKGFAEGFSEGLAKGLAKGLGKGLLGVLESRGFRLTKSERERIVSCADTETLKTWLRRAAVVDSVDEVFE